MVEIEDIIETIQKLEVKKGDAIILKINSILSLEAYKDIAKALEKVLKRLGFNKNEIPILILEDGTSIEILRLTK